MLVRAIVLVRRIALRASRRNECTMSSLSLTYASCRYDRIEPLRAGEVQVEGIDLNVIVFPSGRQIFDRMVGGQEFDASELSASEFISLAGRGNSPFVAIPVFPSRVFRHGYMFVNARAGIRAPKDLAGRRIGVPLYTQTAAIWQRGHLMHQFGVDIDRICHCAASYVVVEQQS